MLRTFIAGAIAAFVGSRLIKANEAGKLDPYKQRLRDGADKLKDRVADRDAPLFTPNALSPAKPASAPAASRKARKSPSDEVSKPAKAHPWPTDPKATPGD
jgi:hypothetical protein